MNNRKHAFLVSAFQYPEYVEKLIDMLDGRRSNIYLHINKRNYPDFCKMIKNFEKRDNIFFVSPIKVNWGGKSLLDSLKIMLQEACKKEENYFFHFISGQDALIRPIEYLYDFFDKNSNNNYIKYYDSTTLNETLVKVLDERITLFHTYDLLEYRSCVLNKIAEKAIIAVEKMVGVKRNLPDNNIIHGEGWFSLNRKAISILLRSMEDEKYYARWRYSFATEEMFTHTVLFPYFSDLNVINKSLRYAQWNKDKKQFPAILDETFYDCIMNSDCLFCRKIDPQKSSKLLKRLMPNITLNSK